MSLRTYIRDQSGALVEIVDHVEVDGWEITEQAEEGANAISTVYMDDAAMDLDTLLGPNDGGHRAFLMLDDEIPGDDKFVASGYTWDRKVSRRYDHFGNPLGRAWQVNITDPNSVLQRRVEKGSDCKRPAETDVARIAWLISTSEFNLVTHFKVSTANPVHLDAHDYRGELVGSVIADCSQASGKNWWCLAIWDTDAYYLTFWYGKDTVTGYESTLSLSNDLADLDLDAIGVGTATIWPYATDTELAIDPSRVYSGGYLSGDGVAVYRNNPATSAAFAHRDTTFTDLHVHTTAQAGTRVTRYLNDLDTEDQRITTALLLPRTLGSAIRAGMLIDFKGTHLPGFEDFVTCRIVSRSIAPRAAGTMYQVGLVLIPLGPAEAGTVCATSLANAVTAALDTQAYDGGDVAIDIAPDEGFDTLILGGLLSKNNNVPCDTDMAGTGGWDTLYSSEMTIGAPTVAHVYDTFEAVSGTKTVTGSFTPGYGPESASRWCAVSAAIRTSATGPVQTKNDVGNMGLSITLDSPPAAGSAIIACVSVRGATAAQLAYYMGAGDGFWTALVTAECSTGVSTDSVGLFMHCAGAGEDGGPYTYNGGGYRLMSISEWEII